MKNHQETLVPSSSRRGLIISTTSSSINKKSCKWINRVCGSSEEAVSGHVWDVPTTALVINGEAAGGSAARVDCLGSFARQQATPARMPKRQFGLATGPQLPLQLHHRRSKSNFQRKLDHRFPWILWHDAGNTTLKIISFFFFLLLIYFLQLIFFFNLYSYFFLY